MKNLEKSIYIIEDDPEFAECLARYCDCPTRIFSDVLEAISALDSDFPCLIFLDILLTGPDGFTLLNELASYEDTARIPIVIVSSLDFSGKDLSSYGVVATLKKEELTPKEIKKYATRYSH